MSLFEEKSGVVVCKTDWGSWAQTIDDVVIEINVPKGTKSKEIKCNISPKSLAVSVQGKEIVKVYIFNAILSYRLLFVTFIHANVWRSL